MNRLRSRISVFLILIFFGIFLKCAAPTLYVGDSGEFIISALSLSISHPPGYPLFSLLVKPFTILPYGNLAFRVNAISSLLASFCLVLAFLFFTQFVKTEAALFSTIFFGFSYLFWNNAVAPEVYHLHLTVFTIILFMLLKSFYNFRFVLLLTFTLTLGLGNHYLVLYLFPLLGFTLFYSRRHLSIKRIVILLFLAMLGASILIYFPLRATQDPLLNWSNPDNLTRLVSHIKREIYQRLEFSTPITFFEKMQFTQHFLQLWLSQFFFIFSPLVIWGAIKLYQKNITLFFICLYLFLMHSLFTIFFFHFPYNSQNMVRVEPYYLPCSFIGFFWLAFVWPDRSAFQIPRFRQGVFLGGMILLLFTTFIFYKLPYFKTYQNISHRNIFYPYYYGKNMLDSATSDSHLFLSEDTETNSAFFLVGILKYRDDLSVYSWNNARVAGPLTTGEIYLSLERKFAAETAFKNRRLLPSSHLFVVGDKDSRLPVYLAHKFNYINLYTVNNSDYRFNWLLSNTYLMRGFIAKSIKLSESLALYNWDKALRFAQHDYLSLNNLGTVYYQNTYYNQAKRSFLRSLELFPRYVFAYYNLGLIALKQNDPKQAKDYFQKAIEIKPDYRPAIKKLNSLN